MTPAQALRIAINSIAFHREILSTMLIKEEARKRKRRLFIDFMLSQYHETADAINILEKMLDGIVTTPEWNIRPLEDALKAEVDRLQKENDELREKIEYYKGVLYYDIP